MEYLSAHVPVDRSLAFTRTVMRRNGAIDAPVVSRFRPTRPKTLDRVASAAVRHDQCIARKAG
jgi:hypothetical protein